MKWGISDTIDICMFAKQKNLRLFWETDISEYIWMKKKRNTREEKKIQDNTFATRLSVNGTSTPAFYLSTIKRKLLFYVTPFFLSSTPSLLSEHKMRKSRNSLMMPQQEDFFFALRHARSFGRCWTKYKKIRSWLWEQ